MTFRRAFLERLAALPLAGSLVPARAAADRNLLLELGVKPVINGAGAYTFVTGSLMRPEVVAAIASVSKQFVRLDELHDAVGKRIASLLGCEAAMVPSGAAAALTLGTAACITGADPELIRRIPDPRGGLKNEVIVQKSHRFPYDHMVRNCGVHLIEVETPEELEKAIGPQTAHLLFLNKAEPAGQVKMERFVEIARKHRVPAFNDAAADVPPLENLKRPLRIGFDLVAISGGKGIRGPQSAGLLLGRADLIRAARMNTTPNSDTIGRSCKVNKEEMCGMLVALEMYLKHDHQADWRQWERGIETMSAALKTAAGVRTERFVPEIANQTPHLRVTWDESKIPVSRADAMRRLREGEPSIELVPDHSKGLEIAAWMLQPGEPEIIARRLRAILMEGKS